jgi:hypothetical protein
MNAGESPEQRYDRLQQTIQEAILRDYPNPERKGCPGSGTIRELAADRLTRGTSAEWEHVTHCSPCYGEYLKSVEEYHQKRKRRNRAVLAGGIVGLCILGLAIWKIAPTTPVPSQQPDIVQRPPAVGQPEAIAAVLNLESLSATRGESGTPKAGDEIQRLPRRNLQLSIFLPIGSKAGPYDVQILRESSPRTPLVSQSGEARIVEGLSRLEINLDLSGLEPGTYLLGSRHAGSSWRYFRVVLT